MKHNIEGIEAFAWQPQTPIRARASSLSGACALLSKLSSSSSGSLLREGSLGQVRASSWLLPSRTLACNAAVVQC